MLTSLFSFSLGQIEDDLAVDLVFRQAIQLAVVLVGDVLDTECQREVVAEDDVRLTDAFFAPGYGQLNPATVEAMELAARAEALILDPVYTGKTMADFIQRARQAEPGQSLLFIHTGGTPALFAYGEALDAAMTKTRG